MIGGGIFILTGVAARTQAGYALGLPPTYGANGGLSHLVQLLRGMSEHC